MGRRRRRRHTQDFKAPFIAQCTRPGVSVAAVALAHSLNANMLRNGSSKPSTSHRHCRLRSRLKSPCRNPHRPSFP
ncbi:transposase [Pseudacidovorax sp. RU35E]|uniref:transposase n=1 Tax=Pseudacidovorax sp. RU35E TaxID=1907403 RepID=UPI0009704C85